MRQMWIGAMVLCLTVVVAAANTPYNLRTEQSTRRVTVAQAPRFAWALQHGGHDVQQTAYQVRVGTAPGLSDMWDSQRVTTPLQHCVYGGPLLPPARSFYWDVEWFVGDLSQGRSPSVVFDTAPTEWTGSSWIGTNVNMFRKEFMVTAAGPLKVFVAGLGFSQVYINSQRLGSDVLTGAWTTFNERVLYYTYEIPARLLNRNGANAIAVMLGHGWRNETSFPYRDITSACDQYERLLRALVVDASGKTVLGTDETWNVSAAGPITLDSIYNGETYDARREMPGWDQPGFAPAPGAWQAAKVVTCMNATQLTPITMPPITVNRTNAPVRIYSLDNCPSTVVSGMVSENTILTLTCKPGTGSFTKVQFASFGTPLGNCSGFQKSSCNSPSSVQIVNKACLGQTSCSLNASNDVFGPDPCFGTVKFLAVALAGCQPDVNATKYIVDFGENLSGWVRMRVNGTAGTAIVLRHAEVLQHPPYGPVDGSIYTGNLRSALATDTYILKGDAAGEMFEPHFTYHGFQYIEVSGWPGVPTKDNFEQVHFHTANDVRVKFSSSSTVLNAIQNNAVMGQGSNMMSVPTDCDQRDERLGWMGDAGLSADTMAINYDLIAFQENYVRNMVDQQNPKDYSLPDVVPFQRYGNQPADPSWSAAFPQNVWVQFKYFGNLQPASTYWEPLMLYLENIASQVKKAGGFSKWTPSYGDWVPAGPKVSGQVCSSFNYIQNVRQLSELAAALDKSSNASALSELEKGLVENFASAFFNTSTQCWDNCGQSAIAMSILAGAVKPSEMGALVQRLVHDITVTQQNHITTGIIGAKALFQVLAQAQQMDVAVALAEQTTYPSWGYMLYNTVEPATSSLWELWNSPTEGPVFSSISQFLVQNVGGLEGGLGCTADEPIRLTAASSLAISRANTSLETWCGTVALDYVRAGGIQCVRSPEGRSPTQMDQKLPLVEDAVLDCGEQGGTIVRIEFASWGRPSGICGGTLVVDKQCHHPESLSLVEQLCVTYQRCTIPMHADFWGASPPCGAAHDGRVFFAQAVCSQPQTVHASISVPVGRHAEVRLPAAILSAESLQQPGVRHVASTRNSTVVTVGSGRYSFSTMPTAGM